MVPERVAEPLDEPLGGDVSSVSEERIVYNSAQGEMQRAFLSVAESQIRARDLQVTMMRGMLEIAEKETVNKADYARQLSEVSSSA